MGVMNQDLSADIEAFLNHAFSAIGDRLRNLRILLLHKTEYGETDPALLLFPEEFENLKHGISSFMKASFQETRIRRHPFCAAFTSAAGVRKARRIPIFSVSLG